MTILIGLGAVSVQPSPAASSPAIVHTVRIEAMHFQPVTLTVAPGDVVVWVNRDVVPHTATSPGESGFDSGVIAPGKSWRYEVRDTGEHEYLCVLHPTMKGTLRVVGAQH